jgi:hypothetical protein
MADNGLLFVPQKTVQVVVTPDFAMLVGRQAWRISTII